MRKTQRIRANWTYLHPGQSFFGFSNIFFQINMGMHVDWIYILYLLPHVFLWVRSVVRVKAFGVSKRVQADGFFVFQVFRLFLFFGGPILTIWGAPLVQIFSKIGLVFFDLVLTPH